MDFMCQQSAKEKLRLLANDKCQRVIISGPPGCGKTYLMNEYARMLGVEDIVSVKPTVQEIRSSIEESSLNQGKEVVVCVENLDTGVRGASYTLLKFLEEPPKNIYIVVTCRSIYRIPDTIMSRCVCVECDPPKYSDIQLYGQSVSSTRYQALCRTRLWSSVDTFSEADKILNLDDAKLSYLSDLSSSLDFSDSVNSIVWKLYHYESNNEEFDPALIIKHLMVSSKYRSSRFNRLCISCLKDLSSNTLGKSAVLSKFVLECKYTCA